MGKNHLLEAAAEILKASHAAGHKDPEDQTKIPAEVHDMGGSTYDNPSGGKLNILSKDATPPGPAPKVGAMPAEKLEGDDSKLNENKDEKDEKESKETQKCEDECHDKSLKEEVAEQLRKSLKEDIDAILKEESGLSDEFRKKVATIYEARILDKVSQIEEQLIEAFDNLFEERVLKLEEEVDAKVDDYLNYVVEEWLKENEVAVTTGLKSELTEEFLTGLHQLFKEHYIEIPDEKVDVIKELTSKIEELETKLNEEIQSGIDLKKQLTESENKVIESKKLQIVQTVCEGLTQTQLEKVRTLVEGVEYATDGDYKEKVKTIRENYFPVTKSVGTEINMLTEESGNNQDTKVVDSIVSAYARAISQRLPR